MGPNELMTGGECFVTAVLAYVAFLGIGAVIGILATLIVSRDVPKKHPK